MATRRGRRFKDPCIGRLGGCSNASPYLSILCNNVQIFGEDVQNVPPTFIIRTLVERGSIAYFKEERRWAAYVSVGGKYRNNLPKQIRVIGDEGYLSEPLDVNSDNSGDVCIIPANAFFTPPYLEILERVDTLNRISISLEQNLESLRQATAIVYDDPDMKAPLEVADTKRRNGESTVLIPQKVGTNVEIKNFSPDAKNYISDLLALWVQTAEELDERAGKVKVGEKTERRTDDEIGVIENSASTSIDVIIDTFNNFCHWYGIKARAERGSEVKIDKKEDGSENDGNTREVPDARATGEATPRDEFGGKNTTD